MIGSVLLTMTPSGIGVTRYTITWTSNASGIAQMRFDGKEAILLAGRLLYATTCPETGGAPTDNYDIYLYDAYNNDVAQGKLIDRDNATAEIVPICDDLVGGYKYALTDTHGPLRLYVSGAGAGKSGKICLYALVVA